MSVDNSMEGVKRVIDAFERSDWTEIDVRFGDVRVHLSTTGSFEPAAPPATAVAPGPRPVVEHDPADSAGGDEPASGRAEAPVGSHLVVAPSPGIFWRSPQPGAPPFADVGDLVEPSSTMCIIEVMKLMSHLKAGVSGEVVAVLAENAQAVDRGDPLFAIRPDGPDAGDSGHP